MRERPLEGRVAIVTGAGRGIGRAIALALAGHGAQLALAARREADLQAVRAEIETAGGQAACIPTDVSREPEVVRLVRRPWRGLAGWTWSSTTLAWASLDRWPK